MRRLRVLLFAVAIALGVPVALLAWRALDGLEMERAVRHQTVVERVFDEMERSLSAFLEREERRPFEEYAARLPDGRPSPLASASEPFVVGAFQIDPGGSLTIPLEASGAPEWVAIDTVRGVVTRAFEAAEGDADAKAGLAESRELQEPGTTRVAGVRKGKDAPARKSELGDAEEASAYEVIQSLNRAAGERSKRRRDVALSKQMGETKITAPSASPMAQSPSVSSVAADDFAAADSQAGVISELEVEQLRALGYTVPSEPSATSSGALVYKAGQEEPREDALSLAARLEPMLGRPAGEDHILLYRTVLRGRQGYRQGLVIDKAALGAWLEGEVVQSTGLANFVSLSFGSPGALSGNAAGTFLHRFAEPFDALSARMQLGSLPGEGGFGVVHALVGLLAIVGAAGLFAIHRMVSVVVQFAERRNNFVAAVTHELKTPLTAIRMYAEMLRDGMVRDDQKRDEYYGTITDESERLSRLIDNVLEFSRLERNSREMNWIVGAPGPVIQDVSERLAAHAARAGFTIETRIEPGLPAIRFDRDALVQVLFNLVDNAMKYARSATERRIVLEASRSEAGVSVAVRDFGPGVPGSHLSKIFEPFYRGEDELTRTTKGTGIGLALVKELVQRMDAAVTGRNADDGGFRVEISFAAAR